LQSKQREKKDEAMHVRDIERLVTEIEMLRVVLYCVEIIIEEACS
jgi:hypothetical protein